MKRCFNSWCCAMFLLPAGLFCFGQGYQQEMQTAGTSSVLGRGVRGYCPSLKNTGRKGDFLVLYDKGKSNYQIVLPDTFSNEGIGVEIRKCAEIMRRAFLESAGVEVKLVAESAMEPGKPAIFIGNTSHTAKAGISCGQFYGQDCILASDGVNLYLAGNDRHTAGKREASRLPGYFYIAGTVRAMLLFMDRYMGVRFLLPGETGIEYPERDCAKVPADLFRIHRQPLEYSIGGQIDFLYDYARCTYGHSNFLMQGGHSYYSAVPKARYAKSHPEYFILRDGKRDPSMNHLCISNPEVQRLMYEFSLKILTNPTDRRDGTEIGQTDGFIPCQCEACAAYGNTQDWGEKLWILHRDLAEKLRAAVPDKKVVIISYGPTANPPKTFRSFPDNVIIELCNYFPEDFEKWKNISVPGGFSAYIYWGVYYQPGITPSKSPRALWKDAKLFSANHVKGISRDGNAHSFGLEGASYYVFSKLLENPDADYKTFEEEYYEGMFPDCLREMREFFGLLYKRVDAFYTLRKQGELPDDPRPFLNYVYTPELLARLEYLLSQAERKTSSEKVKKRLMLVRKEFDYVKHTGTVIQLYHAYLLRPGDETFSLLADAIDSRNSYIASLFDGNKKKPIPGWPEIEVFRRMTRRQLQLNGIHSAVLETPLGWNVKQFRKEKIRPGTSMIRKAVAAPVRGEILPDQFESGAWKNAQWQVLAGYQGGIVSRQTRFKVLYDDENLYLGIESELDEGKKFTPIGKDSTEVTRQDYIELMIDPLGSRKLHYHLLYNPVADSRYDRAFGLIQDTLDPRYGQPDPAWNGNWSYTTARKAGKWYSVVTLPYAMLKVAKPDTSSLWTINVGRTIRGPEKTEYSLWAPQKGKFDFSDRESFGELGFGKP